MPPPRFTLSDVQFLMLVRCRSNRLISEFKTKANISMFIRQLSKGTLYGKGSCIVAINLHRKEGFIENCLHERDEFHTIFINFSIRNR